MATLRETQQRIDNWLEVTILPELDARQATYLRRRRYWQGLRSHTTTPNHTRDAGDDKPPDRTNTRPTDQAESWEEFWPGFAGNTTPAALDIDVYDGPRGPGYTVTTTFRWEGAAYSRIINVGPETGREQAWQELEPPIALVDRIRTALTSFIRPGQLTTAPGSEGDLTMSPVAALFRSRKFLLLLLDTVIAAILYFGGRYLAPDAVEELNFLIGILQPVFVAVIVGIAWEDNNRRDNTPGQPPPVDDSRFTIGN